MRTSVTKNGFTLPEVVVAAALLLIAIVPVLKALTTANLDSIIIERRTQSLYFAQGKLDQLKAKSIYNFNNNFDESNTSLGNSYLCKVVQTAVGSDLKAIAVSVGQDINRSNTLDDNEKEITLQTQIARRW
jgi:prepilin-type N-terminal cleavage/methylation domain-containing protein